MLNNYGYLDNPRIKKTQDSKIEILKTKTFQEGEKAALLEKKIIIENRDIAYTGEKTLKQKGDTECFNKNINISKYI